MRSTKFKIISVLIIVGSLTAGLNVFVREEKPKAVITSNYELIDSNNHPVSLSQYRGKVIFINNWASWCPPCIAEMPSIQKLKNSLKDENIVFLMVSYDDKPEKALRFIQKNNLDFEVYFPGDKYPFHTESIPATFVIDKNGQVAAAHQGMAKFDKPEVVEKIKSLTK